MRPTRFVNLITFFYGEAEHCRLILGAAPLSLFRELHFHPGSRQTVGAPT